MPLLHFHQLSPKCKMAIWDIRESEGDLELELQKIGLQNFEIQSGNLTHRLQKMAVRVLLYKLLGNTDCFFYDTDGKPYFPSERNLHLSISHAHDKAAIILSEQSQVGIDLELIKEKIHSIKTKFLQPEELLTIQSTQELYVAWCAKEALYKYYGKKGVSLKEHIRLSPFRYHPDGGILKAAILPASLHKITVHYHTLGQYMLAYIS